MFSARPVRSHLVYELVRLDREFTAAETQERWEDWYAARLSLELIARSRTTPSPGVAGKR